MSKNNIGSQHGDCTEIMSLDNITRLTLQTIVRILDDVTGQPQETSWRAKTGQIRPDDLSALRVLAMSLDLKMADVQTAHEAVSERLIGTHTLAPAVVAKGFTMLKKPSLSQSEKRALESALINYSQQMGQFSSQMTQLKNALERREFAGWTSAASIMDGWISSMRQLSTDFKTVLGKGG